MTDRSITPHVEDEACVNHCFWHQVDETGVAWEWCFECGHGYRTEKELIQAWRQGQRDCRSPGDPWVFSNSFAVSRLRGWWWRLRIRVEDITFCPMCLHDW